MLEKTPTGKYLVYAGALRLIINITQLHSKNNYCECIVLGCSRCSRTSGLTSLRRAILVRSADSSSGESEEKEEAIWKYVVKYIILYCHLPCLVNIQLS